MTSLKTRFNIFLMSVFFTIKSGFVCTDCVHGFYGDSCDQPCHCRNDEPCDVITGYCYITHGYCEPGYTSSEGINLRNCQQWEGCFSDCKKTCHCFSGYQDCDETTGQCQFCDSAWGGDPACQTGIVDFHAVGKSNPHQPNNFTCAAFIQDDTTPPYAYQMWMTSNDLNGPRLQYTSTMASSSPEHDGVVRHVFVIPSASLGSVFYCRLSINGSAQYAESRANLYELPTLSTRPSIKRTAMSSITLEWPAWGHVATDTGDGPVIEYRIYYIRYISTDNTKWTHAGTIPSVNSSQTRYENTVTDLDPGVLYKLYVTAVRQGGAEGPPSLYVEAVTMQQHATVTQHHSTVTQQHTTVTQQFENVTQQHTTFTQQHETVTQQQQYLSTEEPFTTHGTRSTTDSSTSLGLPPMLSSSTSMGSSTALGSSATTYGPPKTTSHYTPLEEYTSELFPTDVTPKVTMTKSVTTTNGQLSTVREDWNDNNKMTASYSTGFIKVLVFESNAVQIAWRLTGDITDEKVTQYLIFYHHKESDLYSTTPPTVIHVDGSQHTTRIGNLLAASAYVVRVDATTNDRYFIVASIELITPSVICTAAHNTIIIFLSSAIALLALCVMALMFTIIRRRRIRGNTAYESTMSIPPEDNTYAYINRIDYPPLHHDNMTSLPGKMTSLPQEVTSTCYPESEYQTLDDLKLSQLHVEGVDRQTSDCDEIVLKPPEYNPEYHVLEG